MPKFHCYGAVQATKYLGVFEGETAQEAIENAWEEAGVSLCHQCEGEAENAEIEDITAIPVLDGETDDD